MDIHCRSYLPFQTKNVLSFYLNTGQVLKKYIEKKRKKKNKFVLSGLLSTKLSTLKICFAEYQISTDQGILWHSRNNQKNFIYFCMFQTFDTTTKKVDNILFGCPLVVIFFYFLHIFELQCRDTFDIRSFQHHYRFILSSLTAV